MVAKAAELVVELGDADATAQLGEDVHIILRPGDLVRLYGDLGAGKSTLARGLVRAATNDPEHEVPSPTFTLVQTYDARVPIVHADFYRLEDAAEAEELGIDESLETGAVLVEWPERAEEVLPATGLAIHLELADGGARRVARIGGQSEIVERLARSLRIRGFLDASGFTGARRRHLTGDASTRTYETIFAGVRDPVVLMNAPRAPDGPPVRNGKPYSRIAHLAEEVRPFVAIDSLLRTRGFCAPEIHAADLDAGLLLLENLGSGQIIDEDRAPVAERYLACAELLARMHEQEWPDRVDLDDGSVHRIPAYDRAALGIEVELLPDWYAPNALGGPLPEADQAAFLQIWGALFDRLERAGKSLVLRDFHSPNIIWRPDRKGGERIGLIDFQDAVIGPEAYDLASLAQDARVDVSRDLENALIDFYCATRNSPGFDEESFRETYAIMAAQRANKILGIFVRLNERDGKPAYLAHLPRMRQYLRRSLEHPVLSELASWCSRVTGL